VVLPGSKLGQLLAYLQGLAVQGLGVRGAPGSQRQVRQLAVRELADVAKELEEELTVRYGAAGASWAQLGSALDVRRATASERHARITRSRASERAGTP
jgi:hypothetical protein